MGVAASAQLPCASGPVQARRRLQKCICLVRQLTLLPSGAFALIASVLVSHRSGVRPAHVRAQLSWALSRRDEPLKNAQLSRRWQPARQTQRGEVDPLNCPNFALKIRVDGSPVRTIPRTASEAAHSTGTQSTNSAARRTIEQATCETTLKATLQACVRGETRRAGINLLSVVSPAEHCFFVRGCSSFLLADPPSAQPRRRSPPPPLLIMDEHIGLTPKVAEQILQRAHIAQLHDADTAAGTAQRLHNILLQFPTLLHKPQAQTNVFQIAEAVTRSIAKWPQPVWSNSADSAAATSVSPSDSTCPSTTQLYLVRLLQQIFSMRAHFTTKQTARLNQWAEELRAQLGDNGEERIWDQLQCIKLQFNTGNPFANLQLAPFTVPELTHAQLSTKSSTTVTAAAASASSRRSVASSVPFFFLPRTTCPSCHRAQPFYCTFCCEVIHPLALNKLPQVELSLRIDIVMHPAVLRHKSTALQTLLLVHPRSHISVHTFPALPVFDVATTVVMFPSDEAKTVPQIAKDLSAPESGSKLTSMRRVVFLEGTWAEAKLMLAHPKLKSLTALRLDFGSVADSAASESTDSAAPSTPSTAFWRYQRFGPSFLSSIEAIFHTLKQLDAHGLMPVEDNGTGQASSVAPSPSRFDNVLWLFAMSYERVRAHYRQNSLLLPPVQS